jgi:hypothetical protein
LLLLTVEGALARVDVSTRCVGEAFLAGVRMAVVRDGLLLGLDRDGRLVLVSELE